MLYEVITVRQSRDSVPHPGGDLSGRIDDLGELQIGGRNFGRHEELEAGWIGVDVVV